MRAILRTVSSGVSATRTTPTDKRQHHRPGRERDRHPHFGQNSRHPVGDKPGQDEQPENKAGQRAQQCP